MKATVSCPGSCGELVQGTVDGTNFLVTCPVNIYSRVSVSLASGTALQQPTGNKTREAVRRTLEYLHVTAGVAEVQVDSQLPVGKGMASSSADISAACLAAALAAGRAISASAIGDIALAIEPTDGIFLPGITMFDHVHGLIRRCLGQPPALLVAIFDVGGEVDTIHFNQRTDLADLNRRKEPQVLAALQMVERGIKNADCSLIGAGATLSALANQPILRKPSLEHIIEMAGSFGAVGVNAAHSGTVLGVLFDAQAAERVEECISAICRQFPEMEYFRTASIVSGGLTIVEAPSHDR